MSASYTIVALRHRGLSSVRSLSQHVWRAGYARSASSAALVPAPRPHAFPAGLDSRLRSSPLMDAIPARVLILEDEPIIGLALEDMLLALGVVEVAYAETLTKAEAILSSFAIEFAVLDVNIHGQQSYRFAESLRERSIPFVFATGYGDSRHPEQLRAVPTIAKPYSLSDLEAAIASVRQ